MYSVSQCESKNPPPKFSDIFPNGWEFLVQILHIYYTFLSTLDYTFLFNYLFCNFDEVMHIKRDHDNVLKMSTIGRNARWVVALNMA